MTRRNLYVRRLALLAAVAACSPALAQLSAFPGAEGFASTVTGGRGGTIYHVTNLNDSGAGSFRDAVSASNRIIVFDVGGIVNLSSAVSAKSNLTILGQTAPGGGISLNGYEVSFANSSNVIARYLHFRPGDGSPSSDDGVSLYNAKDVILDHLSIEFGKWNNIDAVTDNGASPNVTIQNSIIADALYQQFGAHLEAVNGHFTLANNLWANNHNRNPLAKVNEQFVNNIEYNNEAGYTTHTSTPFSHDLVNNAFIYGPASGGNSDYYQLSSGDTFYATGNVQDTNLNGVLDGSTSNPTTGTIVASPNFSSTTNLPTLTVTDAYAYVLAHAGASLTRDELDALVLSQVQTLGSGTSGKGVGTTGPTGGLYGSAGSDGLSNSGLGTTAAGSRPAGFDSDNDGIPDAWESAHGLNPNLASDALLLNPLGYRMIEQYANELGDVNATRTFNTSGNLTTSANWSGGLLAKAMDNAEITGTGAANTAATLSSGTLSVMSLKIGGNGPAAPGESLTLTGGKLDVFDTLTLGSSNNATLTLSAGGTLEAGNIVLGNTVYSPSAASYTGSLILNGGTLRTGQIVLGAGTPGNYTAGGSISVPASSTLQAISNPSIKAPITLSNNATLTLDSNSFSGSVTGVISGSGSITKTGSGAIDLTASNSFTGGVTLLAGSLGISSDANLAGPNTPITFAGGLLRINGTSLTTLGAHPVNFSSFNGGFDINSSTNVFSVPQSLSGPGSLTKAGAGTLLLTGTNSYTGGTTLTGGVTLVSDDANLGASSGVVNLAGGTLRITGTAMSSTAHPLTVSSAGGTLDINDPANTFNATSPINGTGPLTKAGAGTLVLSAQNNLDGQFYPSAGTTRVNHALAFRFMTVNLTSASGTLDLNGINATLGGLAGSQPLNLGSSPNISVGNNNDATSYSGVISGTGGITKIGTGVTTLTGASTYTGSTVIQRGTLAITALANGGVASNLGAGSTDPANLVLDGGTLKYAAATGAAATSTDRSFTLTANGGTLDGGASGGPQWRFLSAANIATPGSGDRTLTLTGGTSLNDLYLGLTDPDSGGKTSLVMNGTGRWILTNSNRSYSGDTTVSAGTLMTNTNNPLPFGPGKGNLVIASGATYEMNNRDLSINALNGAGAVNQRGTSSNSGTKTLTLGYGDASGSFSGVISTTPSTSGQTPSISLVKVGNGTQTLSGSNTFLGTATVNAGVLRFNFPTSIPGTGATITVNDPGAAAPGYIMDQSFLSRITPASTGAAALTSNTANNLDFTTLPTLRLGAVGNVTYSGTLTPANNTYRLGGANGTLTLTKPLTDPTRSLDLSNGALVLPSPSNAFSTLSITGASLNLTTTTLTLTDTPAPTLRSYLQDHELFSSNSDATHTLGYAPAAGSSLIIHLTLTGDANLDGIVNADDYALLDRSLAASRTNATWTDGDFNYDGTVDSSDYLLIDTTLALQQGGHLSPAFLSERESQFGPDYVASLVAAVPEPSLALSSILYPLSALLLKRRRSTRFSSSPSPRRADLLG